MIDSKTIAQELQHARKARLEAEAEYCDIEEMLWHMHHPHPAHPMLHPRPVHPMHPEHPMRRPHPERLTRRPHPERLMRRMHQRDPEDRPVFQMYPRLPRLPVHHLRPKLPAVLATIQEELPSQTDTHYPHRGRNLLEGHCRRMHFHMPRNLSGVNRHPSELAFTE